MKRYIIFLSLFPFLLTGCSETDEDNNTGRQDLVIKSRLSVLPATRSSYNETWDGREMVAVRSTQPTSDETVVLKYQVGADGIMKGVDEDNTFYWRSPNDPDKSVTAWYEAQTPDGFSATPPDGMTMTVPADQHKGLQGIDFLYAPAVNFSYIGERELPFYHQLAKVRIRVTSTLPIDGGASNATFGTDDDKLATTGTFTAPTGKGKCFGLWTLPANGEGASVITPLASTPDIGGFIAQYEAFVMPQPIKGKTLIKLNIGDKTYTYKEDSGVESYLPGCVYTYNLRVSNGGMLINTTLKDWAPDALDDLDKMNVIVTTQWNEFTGNYGTQLDPDGWTKTDKNYGTQLDPDDWTKTDKNYGTLLNADAWMQTDKSYGSVSKTVEWMQDLNKYGSLAEVIKWNENNAAEKGTTVKDNEWGSGGNASGSDVPVEPWAPIEDNP